MPDRRAGTRNAVRAISFTLGDLQHLRETMAAAVEDLLSFDEAHQGAYRWK